MARNSEFVSTSRIQSTKEHKASKERGERNKKNQLVTAGTLVTRLMY